MDGFSYYNIFDTKGIEYLLIIAFLLLLIPFWLALNKQVKIKEQFRKALGVLSANLLRIPQGIFYSKNHTWAYLEKSGIARVGLDDLLLHITGEVDVHPLKNQGEMIKKGDLVAEIDQNGKSLRIYSPISGEVISANPVLSGNRELLNDDPYGKGWIYNIRPSNWKSEISTFYLAGEATDWLKRELDHYKDFLATNLPKYTPETSMVMLQDGGELIENSLSGMPNELWQDFQKEFLAPS
jgi:glycine cleavage system H protein